MNVYEIRINGARITATGSNEYSAIRSLGICEDIEMIEAVRTYEEITANFGWIYQAKVNDRTAIVYVKRV